MRESYAGLGFDGFMSSWVVGTIINLLPSGS